MKNFRALQLGRFRDSLASWDKCRADRPLSCGL